jgi:hypothetical protein
MKGRSTGFGFRGLANRTKKLKREARTSRKGLQPVTMRFQTHRPTIALVFRDDHQVAVTIPAGTLLTVVGRADDPRFLLVEVENELFQAFESDLTNGTASPDAGASKVLSARDKLEPFFIQENGRKTWT